MYTTRVKLESLAVACFAFGLVGTLLTIDARGIGCPPANLEACSVEGGCSPQGPWGYTQTKWRPWPGDEITRPEDVVAEEEEKRGTLEGYEPPSPEDEGLRGSKKPDTRRKKKSTEEATEGPIGELPGELGDASPEPEIGAPVPDAGGFEIPNGLDIPQPEPEGAQPELPQPGEPQPEIDPADDFDPFSEMDRSNLPRLPKSLRSTTGIPGEPNQGPPSLPSSLKKLSRTMRSPAPVYQRASPVGLQGTSAIAMVR